MPFISRRAELRLEPETERQLSEISRSRTEPRQRVERATMLLKYAQGETVSAIARDLRTNRPRVERCLNKALQLGVWLALSDLPGRGRPARLSDADRAWVVSLACQKPKDLGYSYELWTTRLLAEHVRQHCVQAGHPALRKLGRGTVSKLLARQRVRPHKISYYLERRDSEFEAKMAQVLYVYKEVELMRQSRSSGMVAVLSYDEKPGIQAIGNTAPDLPPIPGEHPAVGRDHEYVRHGTVSLMAGIDLLTGHVHGQVVERHRSREFIDFLKIVDNAYPAGIAIRVVLDNHSAHVSKETRTYLRSVPNRFEFIFTPKHGSWLNLIESFFAKMAKSMLRGIRVASKDELKERILRYLQEINQIPVVFRWRYGLESISLV
jgi:transposase